MLRRLAPLACGAFLVGLALALTTGALESACNTVDGGAGCGELGCAGGLACCGGACVNLANDVRNCGACKQACGGGATAFCAAGSCAMAPCDPTAPVCKQGFCCGTSCCTGDEICCEVNRGGPSRGPECVAPTDGGTCPVGCPLCK